MRRTKKKNKIDLQKMKKFTMQRLTAESTLKFSLFFDIAFNLKCEGEYRTNEGVLNYLDDLSYSVFKDAISLGNDSDFNFFGYRGNYLNNGPNDKQNEDLSILQDRFSFWEHIIHQDCILSAFDILRKLIGESYRMGPSDFTYITNRSFIDDLNETDTTPKGFDAVIHGLDYLTQKEETCGKSGNDHPYYKLGTKNGIPFINEIKASSRDPLTNKIHSVQKRTQKLQDQIKESGLSTRPLYLFPPEEANPGNISIQENIDPYSFLSQMEFYSLLPERRNSNKDGISSNIAPVINAYSEQPFDNGNYKEYCECIKYILKFINSDTLIESVNADDMHKNKMLPSDIIYLLSQIEKVFAPLTINCIYQNIAKTANTPVNLCDQKSINLISQCLRLPNVFSRQYILQMAIDTIAYHDDYNFKDDDFLSQKLKEQDSVAFKVHPRDPSRRHVQSILDNWFDDYRVMMDYLIDIFFPVCENYFFCALWDGVKSMLPEGTDADVAVKMYKILRCYLNNDEKRHTLFATEDVIINSEPPLTGFDEKKITRPVFGMFKDFDSKIYKDCLVAHKNTYKDHIMDPFISIDYFNKISPGIKEMIQTDIVLKILT